MALLPYIKTLFINDQAPPLNATNMNKTEDGVEAVTDEAILLGQRVTDVETPVSTTFIPQVTPPIDDEGLLYYDDNEKCLTSYDDISGTSLQIGQETRVRVYNNSGADIANGIPVKGAGAAVGGIPTIIPCQADTFSGAYVAGVTTHAIPDGTEGWVTVIGKVGGVDTSLFAAGSAIYVSATVLGGLTNTIEEIVSRVGVVLSSDVDGSIIVNPTSWVEIPSAFSSLNHGAVAGNTIDVTWKDIANYTNQEDHLLSSNLTTGEILAPVSGRYKVTTGLSISFDIIGNATETLSVRIVGDLGYVGDQIDAFIARDGEVTSLYPSAIGTLVGGEKYKLQIMCTAQLTGVAFSFSSFEIETMHLDLA